MVDYSKWLEDNNRPVTKFFGKWPFRRISLWGYGIQELLSSLFSLLNGVPHFLYLVFWRDYYAPKGYFMRPWLVFYSVVCVNRYELLL